MIHGDVLGERARLSPERIALVLAETGERFSYADLDARARRAGRVLREALSLAKGERFAVLSGNRIELLDLFFAAGQTGLVLVPLSTRLTAREIAEILADAEPRVLVYDGAHADTVRDLQPLVPGGIHCVALDADRSAAPGHASYAGFLAALPPGEMARVRCAPEDLYALLYTSGTTGRPKGVMIPHRMVAWNGYNTTVCWQLREDDVSPVFTPLYHAGGLFAFLVPILTAGGTIVLQARFDPAEVWRTIARERCTVMLGVPTIFKMMLEAPEMESADLSSLRWMISGGAPLPTNVLESYQRRGVPFKQGYGLTEVGVNCFSMTVEESVRKRGSIGRPLLFTEARLVAEDGRDAPTGEVGEMWLRGPHVSLGYWRNPEATAAALDAEGWFHTGDLARRDAEGFFTIAGRQKDMLISGGVNVYPAEIEGELLLHPRVADAAVIGVPDPTWGEVGVAFVVATSEGGLDRAELEAFLAGRLARYKIPREFVFVPSLPRTPYGKVVKGDLRAEWQRRADGA
jgi:fatty-acyl-CoA synthase